MMGNIRVNPINVLHLLLDDFSITFTTPSEINDHERDLKDQLFSKFWLYSGNWYCLQIPRGEMILFEQVLSVVQLNVVTLNSRKKNSSLQSTTMMTMNGL